MGEDTFVLDVNIRKLALLFSFYIVLGFGGKSC